MPSASTLRQSAIEVLTALREEGYAVAGVPDGSATLIGRLQG